MAVIYITEADETQHKFRLPADARVVVTIGRNEDCVISLPNILGLSGLHCSIAYLGGEYVITDEGSSNGTLVGQRAIGSEPLRAGVAYSIGTAVLFFEPERHAAPSAEPPASMPAPVATPAYQTAAPRVTSLMEAMHPQPAAPAPAPLPEAALPVAEIPAAAPEVPLPVAEMPAPAPVQEVLAEPIPVSEYEAPAAPAELPVQEYDEEAEEDEAVAQTRKRRRRVAFKMPDVEKELLSVGNVIYVLVVLAIAFYAGMTLRHWMETGSYLPGGAPAQEVEAAEE